MTASKRPFAIDLVGNPDIPTCAITNAASDNRRSQVYTQSAGCFAAPAPPQNRILPSVLNWKSIVSKASTVKHPCCKLAETN